MTDWDDLLNHLEENPQPTPIPGENGPCYEECPCDEAPECEEKYPSSAPVKVWHYTAFDEVDHE